MCSSGHCGIMGHVVLVHVISHKNCSCGGDAAPGELTIHLRPHDTQKHPAKCPAAVDAAVCSFSAQLGSAARPGIAAGEISRQLPAHRSRSLM